MEGRVCGVVPSRLFSASDSGYVVIRVEITAVPGGVNPCGQWETIEMLLAQQNWKN
jgi:hypothetical protein